MYGHAARVINDALGLRADPVDVTGLADIPSRVRVLKVPHEQAGKALDAIDYASWLGPGTYIGRITVKLASHSLDIQNRKVASV